MKGLSSVELFNLIKNADTDGDGVYSIDEIKEAYGESMSESELQAFAA